MFLLAMAPASVLAQTTAATPRLQVTSTAFGMNEPIPAEYTCEGANEVPPLSWSAPPTNTKSIAILVDDPDAPKGTFTHWLVTGISPSTTSLRGAQLPANAMAAKNDKGTTGYAGPCPPSGTHHYHFRVYALDIPAPKATSRAAFLSEIKGHTLATGELVGTHQKGQGQKGQRATAH